MTPLKLFQPSDTFHTETNHLICCANQMTGFYMKCKTGIKWVQDVSKLCNWGNRWGDWIQSFNWSHYNALKTVMKAPSAFFNTRAWDVEVTLDKRFIILHIHFFQQRLLKYSSLLTICLGCFFSNFSRASRAAANMAAVTDSLCSLLLGET